MLNFDRQVVHDSSAPVAQLLGLVEKVRSTERLGGTGLKRRRKSRSNVNE